MSPAVDLNQLLPGLALPEVRREVIQKDIDLYARAAHDHNPIHIDPEFAKNTAAGGTIAHGMLVLSYISQMMTNAFGKPWLTGGRLNVRFRAPARPGDVLTLKGSVQKVQTENSLTSVTCDVLCSNQSGETVITGEAVLRLEQK